MAVPIVSPKSSQVLGRVVELHRMLEEAGLGFEDLQRPINDRAFRQKLVEFWRGDSNQRFEPAEWETHYGITVPTVPDFPWTYVLEQPCPFIKGKRVRDTHFAFLGISTVGSSPLTIMKLHELHPADQHPKFLVSPDEAWYKEQAFATQPTCQARWYLMLTEAVPGSTNRGFKDQEAMLPPEYEVPLAVEEATKSLLYYRKSGKYPNTTVWARCKDLDSFGRRVCVGSIHESVRVSYWGDGPHSDLAVAASRKVPGT